MDCPVRTPRLSPATPYLDEAVRTDEEVIQATGLRRTQQPSSTESAGPSPRRPVTCP